MSALPQLVHSVSYLGIAAMVFAESGLLAGFFLPGDSLLITAGILAKAGQLNLALLMAVVTLAALLGDSAGYAIGRRFGPGVFGKQGHRFFKPESVGRTRAFFERHGGKALVLARFVPIARAAAPTMAGAGQMSYRRFLSYNLIGGLLWSTGVPALGYALGSLVPHLDRYILLVVGGVVVLSLAAALLKLRKARA